MKIMRVWGINYDCFFFMVLVESYFSFVFGVGSVFIMKLLIGWIMGMWDGDVSYFCWEWDCFMKVEVKILNVGREELKGKFIVFFFRFYEVKGFW